MPSRFKNQKAKQALATDDIVTAIKIMFYRVFNHNILCVL